MGPLSSTITSDTNSLERIFTSMMEVENPLPKAKNSGLKLNSNEISNNLNNIGSSTNSNSVSNNNLDANFNLSQSQDSNFKTDSESNVNSYPTITNILKLPSDIQSICDYHTNPLECQQSPSNPGQIPNPHCEQGIETLSVFQDEHKNLNLIGPPDLEVVSNLNSITDWLNIALGLKPKVNSDSPTDIHTIFNPQCSVPSDKTYSYYLFYYDAVRDLLGLGGNFQSLNKMAHHTDIVRCHRIQNQSHKTGKGSSITCQEFAYAGGGFNGVGSEGRVVQINDSNPIINSNQRRIKLKQYQQSHDIINDDQTKSTSESKSWSDSLVGHFSSNTMWKLQNIYYLGASDHPHHEVFQPDLIPNENHHLGKTGPLSSRYNNGTNIISDGNTQWFSSIYHAPSVNCNAFTQTFAEKFLKTPEEPLIRSTELGKQLAEHGYKDGDDVLFQETGNVLHPMYRNFLERWIPYFEKYLPYVGVRLNIGSARDEIIKDNGLDNDNGFGPGPGASESESSNIEQSESISESSDEFPKLKTDGYGNVISSLSKVKLNQNGVGDESSGKFGDDVNDAGHEGDEDDGDSDDEGQESESE